jgi:hypothetical protein
MDKVLATKVIDTARFYMSGDNCQPFRYRFNIATQTFHIDYLADKAKHALVYDDYTIVISLGGLLTYLETSLAKCGYVVTVNFNLENFSPHSDQKNILETKLIKNEEQKSNDELFAALTKRAVDRRPYKSSADIDIDENLLNDGLQFNQCRLVKDAPADLLNFFASCDCTVWNSKKLGLDIMNSVSFDPLSGTGLPWRNLGLRKAEVFPIRLIQYHHRFYDLLKMIGARMMMKMGQKKLWHSSKSALIFTLKPNLVLEEKINASADMFNILLKLTSLGYAFQPSTLGTEILNSDLKVETNLITSTGMQAQCLTSLIIKHRAYLDAGTNEIQWILRIGKPVTPLPQDSRTNRLDTSTILSFDD